MSQGRRGFAKRYADNSTATRAVANHKWFSTLPIPFQVPALISARGNVLRFEYLPGRHARPADLHHLAGLLGRMDAIVHSHALGGARANDSYARVGGNILPGFGEARRDKLHSMFRRGRVVNTRALPFFEKWLKKASNMEASVYKDANLRNFLVSRNEVAIVDFDTVTLAPFGYDLAKLVVTLAMTYGAISSPMVKMTLSRYNEAAASLGAVYCRPAAFAAWTEFHHVLTTPFLGQGGYNFSWADVRPWSI